MKWYYLFASLLLMMLFGVTAPAQNTLNGIWSYSETQMGIAVFDVMTFDSDFSGNVENKYNINIDINIMGIKMSGEIECSMKGSFKFQDGKLAIKWNPESVIQKTVKPLECVYKGKPAPKEMEEKVGEIEKVITASFEEVKRNANGEKVYDANIRKNKLTLSRKDEDGKSQSVTYSFMPAGN